MGRLLRVREAGHLELGHAQVVVLPQPLGDLNLESVLTHEGTNEIHTLATGRSAYS